MRWYCFSKRVAKEVIRDPLNLCFGIGFPVILLLLLSAIQANIPVSLFEIERLTPGIAVFGLAFFSLFSATLIAKDRGSAFLSRLYTTPMKASDFILGYTLPLLPLALLQSVVCYLVGMLLGLEFSWHLVSGVVFQIPAAVFFIALGLLFGSILGDKQVGGICGALLTNLTAWLSGIWFDLALVGGAFEAIAACLPFLHAVQLSQAVAIGSYGEIAADLLWVSGYAVLMTAAAIIVFLKRMRRG